VTASLDQLPLNLSQTGSLWMLLHLPSMVFVFCLGACVGSFTNVVIYRLPAGMSVITPPSRCPVCGARLRFFRENLPILGWLIIRGKCRYCHARVSPQYMIIELLMALIFLGLYLVLFTTHASMPWLGHIGGPWWTANGFLRAWPVYIAVAFLIAGLIAMTLIDARTFTIPIQIPVFLTAVAFLAFPLQYLLPHRSPSSQTWPHDCAGWPLSLAAILGMLGVLLGVLLLALGKLRYSFADYHEYLREGEPLADYPHARREMAVELLFLAPACIGAAAGFVLGRLAPLDSAPPQFIQVIGAVGLGYLIGGGTIWLTRILGTLAFGREAMGLGDVHLLAAVGAVLGAFPAVMIFFIAPFFGLIWGLLAAGFTSVFRTTRRELPYGPHLAAAAVLFILARPAISALWNAYFPPSFPAPQPGFYEPPETGPDPEIRMPRRVRPDLRFDP